MTEVFRLDAIRAALAEVDVIRSIEDGFLDYARNRVVVPPVGELCFEDPPGEAHIKYGYIRDASYYVIKIASGFYNNPEVGLASSQGVMLVFSQQTGVLKAVLLDEGRLTDERTAAAGAVAAKYLAPDVDRIGILGTGTQARLQLEYLRRVITCDHVVVWGRSQKGRDSFLEHFRDEGLRIEFVDEPKDVARDCRLIVTTTPSKTPLLQAGDIRLGTHITAVGSDTAEKIELEPGVLGQADLVVADSISQALTRGEIHQALRVGAIQQAGVTGLGDLIEAGGSARTSPEQMTVADLTGLAVQDIQIATAVYRELQRQSRNAGENNPAQT